MASHLPMTQLVLRSFITSISFRLSADFVHFRRFSLHSPKTVVMAKPKTVFISGANRGIGFELVKQLLQYSNPPELIFATYRKKEEAKGLFELAEKNKSVKPLQLDVRDHSAFPNIVKAVKSAVGNKGLNLLINNAGILEPNQNLMDVTHEQMINAHEVNVISPLFLSRAFLPLLRTAVTSGHGQSYTWSQSAIINVSSLLGSIELNTSSSTYAYRVSKAAVNMFSKSLSIDLKPDNILVVSLHPGWVKTDLGGPKAPLTTEQSVAHIVKTLSNLDAKANGGFVSYDGKVLPY